MVNQYKEYLEKLLVSLDNDSKPFSVDGYELEGAIRYSLTAITIVEEMGRIIDHMRPKEEEEE